MKVAFSSVNSERFMLSDADKIDVFKENDRKERDNILAAEKAHDDWFAKAKSTPAKRDYDAAILADARRHLEGARKLPLPVKDGSSTFDSRWSPWAESYYKEASSFTTCRDVLHFAQSGIPFDHREPVRDKKTELDTYEKMMSEEFPFRIEEQLRLFDNPESIPETLCLKYGRLVSNIFYWHLRVMFRCIEDITPLQSIFEIGGGYGSLARLWLKNESVDVKRYVIADLPESLFYSEVCLRAEFGDQIGYWEGTDPGTKVVLLPICRLNEYHDKSDLVINVGSMQEMSDSWVDYYMDWIDQYAPKYFYSLNYVGQSLVHMYESRNFWAPHPSRAWTTRLIDGNVPIIKAMCAGRDFAEAIYERCEPTRKFSEWSVLGGYFFNRATYLEGLELLRQDMTVNNAIQFIHACTTNNDKKRLMVPKEVLFIASLIHRMTKDPNLGALIDRLVAAKKIGVH